jgi:hypothetical protein
VLFVRDNRILSTTYITSYVVILDNMAATLERLLLFLDNMAAILK